MPPGGKSVGEVISRELPGWLSGTYGALSQAAIFPAQAAFALRHGAPLDAHDQVVGAHFATEVYPGLGGRERPEQRVPLTGEEPFLIGFEPQRSGARMRGARARILVPLNKRTGPIRLQLRLRSRATIEVRWDGRPLQVSHQGTFEPEVALDPIDRGVHDLDLEAPEGTTLFELLFTIPPGTPP
jgi:hypothetical protein